MNVDITKLISLHKAAGYVGISKPKIEDLVRTGVIDPVFIDGWRFWPTDRMDELRSLSVDRRKKANR